MLTVTAALQRILDTVVPFEPELLPLDQVGGLVLAEEVVSDVDSPPFDKATMDGYAVQSADVASGAAMLTVIERITAGQVPQKAVTPGTAIQIMTGAPIPAGADAVVRVEDTRLDGDTMVFTGRPVSAGANLIRRGTSLKIGENVLTAGSLLTPSRIGALAELGHARVWARPNPQVAVLATGDELVPTDETPGPGQIRNSNEVMLAAQLSDHGALPVLLGIARDDPADLAAKIQQGLESDILVVSGGVSAGKRDLVPAALRAAGVQEVFHKVDLKPGKPVWFGIRVFENSTEPVSPVHATSSFPLQMAKVPRRRRACYVFGLPGNPVSCLVCCELFVRTVVRKLMELEPAEPIGTPAQLTAGCSHHSDRPTYHPAYLSWSATGLTARLVTWHGSSDLRATVDGNGMVLLPTGEREYQAGDTVDAFWWG